MTEGNASSALRVISLGGIGRIGKNMTLFEQGGDLMVVDCGIAFPDELTPGIDVILPDMTYVLENADDLVGIVLTHGHEDHIGALPYLLEQMPARVYGTELTLGLVDNRLSEFSPRAGSEFRTIDAGERLEVGSFDIDVIRVNHSVRDGIGLGIHTDQGIVVHSGDFKFDQTPVDGHGPDFHSLARLGEQKPIATLLDCTGAERPGFTGSERSVGEAFERIFAQAEERVIVTCFASHIARIEQVFAQSAAVGRRVAVAGRSMERNIATARRLGMLEVPPNTELPLEQAQQMPPYEVTVLATGSQGEPFSALTRMSTGDHQWVKIRDGDTVIVSASMIPGNESTILRTIDNLFRRGAHVIYGSEQGVHVSGHASREELRLMLSLTQPDYLIPFHGDWRHLALTRDLAVEMGMPKENVIFMEPGVVVEFADGRVRFGDRVPAGSVNVDGLGVGDVGSVVLSDRQTLGDHGIVLPIVALDTETKEIVGGPEIYSRGFVYMSEAEEIIEELIDEVWRTYERLGRRGPVDPEQLYAELRSDMEDYIEERTGRYPMVLPVIVPVGELPEGEEIGLP